MSSRTLLRTLALVPLFAFAAAVPAAWSETPVTAQVYAAASLTEAFQALGHDVEAAHPGWQLRFTFSGSQELAQQIRQGAPADVFASADDRYMKVVVESRPGTAAKTFARNRLAVVVAASAKGKIKTLSDLTKPGLRLVLADKAVPVGTYTLQMLEKASLQPAYGRGFATQVLKQVVSYETNVRLVLTKVNLDEADAGIVYESDTQGPSARNVSRVEVPAAVNVYAHYPIAVLAGTAARGPAEAFEALVLSKAGQARLQRAGFLPAVAGGK